LWAALGISTLSLVGSPLVLNSKQSQTPDPAAVSTTAALVQQDPAVVQANSQGTLFANPRLSDAALTDMFQGDEIGNTAYLDLAKIQMFFFTLISLVSYIVAMYLALEAITWPKGPRCITELPALPSGMISLMGISHAGYLASKGVDHTPQK
jgi:hypothetical protein